MLGTLLKYEFKAVGRILLPLFGAWIIVAVLLGLSLRGDGTTEANTLMVVLSAVLYGFFSIAAVIVTAIILIQRFYRNLLGSEGYMMFTLPATSGQHITNKMISGTVWSLIGTVAAIATGLAIAFSIEGFASVFDSIHFLIGDIQIALERSPSAFLIIPELLVLLVLGLAEVVAKVYAAIAIGHQWNNHRVLGSIVAYIGISIVEGILTTIVEQLLIYAPMDWYYEASGVAQTHLMLLPVIVVMGVMVAAYWFISWWLLDKRLNLE